MSDTKINDGGPAFPVAGHCVDASGAYCGDVVNSKGLSLRDWFAGQALPQIHVSLRIAIDNGTVRNCDFEELVAASAYIIADAMLAARNKKE